MIWALLWCAYLAVGCVIVLPDIPRGIGIMREAARGVGAPPPSTFLMFVVAFVNVLVWPVFLRVGPRR